MTRKDIIIIAVLVNAGLLAILFMMAVTSDNEGSNDQAEIASLIEIPFGDISQEENTQKQKIDVVKSLSTSDFLDEPLEDEPEAEEQPVAKVESPVQTAIETAKEEEKPAAATKTTKNIEITVKKGDTLDKLARTNGTTVSAIKKASNIKSDRLSIGQVLQVPVSVDKKVTTKTTKPAKITEIATGEEKSAGPKYHVVVSGDNPWKIAKKFHIKVDDLLKLNNLDEEKARNMKIGDKIRVQ